VSSLGASSRFGAIGLSIAVFSAVLVSALAPAATAVPSSDATVVAFTVTSGGVSQIWTMNPDGTDPAALPGQPSDSNTDPATSPDGTQIAFTSTPSGGTGDIWVIDLTGSNLTQLTTDTGNDGAPAWSADGDTIAFQSDRSGNMDIWLMHPDGSSETRLTTNAASDSQPAWFPATRRIAFQSNRSGNADIWTVPAAGGAAKRITTSSAPDTQPSVSPNGATIAFTSRRSNNTDVYTAPAGGGAATRVTTNAAVDNQPAFSTDGRYLSFTSDRSGTAQVWRVPRPSGPSVQLTTGTDPAGASDWLPYDYPSPIWAARQTVGQHNFPFSVAESPDGSKIFSVGAVVSTKGYPVGGFVEAHNSSGTELWREVFKGSAGYGAAYDVAASPDGTKVFVTGWADAALHVGSYDATTGALLAQRNSVFGAYAEGYDILVSPTGTSVFVAGKDYTSTGVPLNSVTMKLTPGLFPQWTESHAHGDPAGPQGMELSPSGDTLYWTGIQYGNPVKPFSKNDYLTVSYRTTDGTQNWLKTYDGPGNGQDNGWALAVSPDAAHVYVSGFSTGVGTGADQATIAYNAATGAQEWVNRYDSPSHRRDWAFSVAVSPDGSTLYTGGGRSRLVGSKTTFDMLGTSINAADGALDWASFYNGPGDSTNGVDAVLTVQVAPDGNTIYFSGPSYRTGTSFDITSFALDTNGSRVWLGRYDGPAHKGDYGEGAVLSPDGSRLYEIGESFDSEWDSATVAWDVSGCLVCRAEAIPSVGRSTARSTPPASAVARRSGGASEAWRPHFKRT
jgi:hypothetical protein